MSHATDLRAPVVTPPAAVGRAIELIEAESSLSQHHCAPEAETRRLGLYAERIGSASAILTRKSKNTLYNKLVGIGQASPATEGQLQRFLDIAREHRVAKVSVPVGSTTRPRTFPDTLQRSGLARGYPGAKLWRDGQPLQRARPGSVDRAVRVRQVAARDAGQWVDVVSQVWRTFGTRRAWFEARVAAPGWRHYLAWVDGEPVGAGALYVGDVGKNVTAGHLVDGVTLRHQRCRGIQSAIIRRRIADGLKLGCTVFTSETAPPLPRMPLVSFRNLCRQGFALAYLRYSYNIEF